MEASTVPAVEESTGSKTIADMMALAAERYGDRAAVKYKRDGAWHDVSFAEVGEIVSEIARGLIDLGLAPGDRVVAAVHDAPRVDLRGLRDHQRGRRRGADLPHQLPVGVRVGGRQLRVALHRLRERRPGGQDHPGPRPTCPPWRP